MGRKRSSSEPVIAGGHQVNARLSKPPRVDTLHERPRNRLQKRGLAVSPTLTPCTDNLGFTTTLYMLEYEPYSPNTLPSQFLGVYSTVDSVTAGAIENGAYTFSREGLLDGSEYLNPTGRIKIRSQLLEQSGTEAAVSVRNHSLDESSPGQHGPIRPDIPHPDLGSNTLSKTTENHGSSHHAARSAISIKSLNQPRETVFLAIRQGPTAAHCLGVCAKKSLAWGSCLKNKASCALSSTLSEESRHVNEHEMPRATARIHGCGQHVWLVVAREIDGTAR
ncbi:hypothetical protein EKO04_006627 [Ascochyta lentis]|uniref:Uncharacterized protein n=1 Tax=Ascochyta lentis TaxID=205686 RepID=A0A8H7J2R8_9PLEO|nr:hypothetical protein EKO04_006627 [Ascochyta lentis]